MDEKYIIYQYTSVETLALILKNQNIKFTKLKLLDDPLEKYVKGISLIDGRLKKARLDLGDYCFVSCWTKEKEESISMWDMYGDRKQGVRIGLPTNMFDKKYNINDPQNIENGNRLFKIQSNNVLPELVDIKYDRVDDPDIYGKNFGNLSIDVLGKYKLPDWEFQKEVRFRLFGCELGEEKKAHYFVPDKFNRVNNIKIDMPISNNSIFFKLDNKIISEMEILIGSNISEGSRILLDALVERYGINPEKIHNSKFAER